MRLHCCTLLAPLALAATACGNSAGVVAGPPWGLDARPSNPTCVAPAKPASPIALDDVFNHCTPSPCAAPFTFTLPVAVLQAPGDASRFFVVGKKGVISAVTAGAGGSTSVPFADVSARVNSGYNESGLLGMAFHPRWQTNHQVFLSYTAYASPPTALNLVSTLSRFTSSDGGATLDPASEVKLLTVVQPYENHNGGNILFGKDGYLYLGLGDGGSGGDPQGNGQDVNVLLAKMLRLDVDGAAPYAIPPDNPFAGGGGRPEIFAWGLRNPWRWSFDRATGLLWAGDVGQDAWEEVDVIARGRNYGWNTREGTHCYAPASNCPTAGLTDPIVDYDHTQGNAITGGYVYRGKAVAALVDSYVYSDSGSGRIWSIPASAANPGAQRPVPQLLLASGRTVVSFGEDLDGELYLTDYGSGRVFKLVAGAAGSGGPPALLSQTGCTAAGDATLPAPGLIPYAPNAPFWSDGAAKDRWLAIPDGARIAQQADGDFDLPAGSVLVKQFTIGGKRIETRLFFRYADGAWAGQGYAWNDAGTDAARVDQGRDLVLSGGQVWTLPGPAQCLACHTSAAGFSLGLEAAQLDGSFTYPGGRSANQLATLIHLGVAASGPAVPALPDPQGSAPLEQRARAVLHANCAQCHRPGGPTPQGDFRFSTAPSQGYCGLSPTAGDLGVAGAKLLDPGHPERSLILLRMQALDSHRMPPLASHLVDQAGVSVLTQWISSLTGCP